MDGMVARTKCENCGKWTNALIDGQEICECDKKEFLVDWICPRCGDAKELGTNACGCYLRGY